MGLLLLILLALDLGSLAAGFVIFFVWEGLGALFGTSSFQDVLAGGIYGGLGLALIIPFTIMLLFYLFVGPEML